MPLPQSLANFDIHNSTVSVWLFKKSIAPEGAPRFTGRRVDTDEELDNALKVALAQARDSIQDVTPYTLLAAAQDGIALRIDALETHADAITAQMADPLAEKKVRSLKEVQNTKFYVVKLTHGDSAVHAVRSTDNSWQSRQARSAISVIFKDEQLGLNEEPAFSISRHVDFFIAGEDIIMLSKPSFEKVLSYKQAHAEDFVALQVEPAFAAIFSDVAPLVTFVGENKIHLRRACVIRQKGHYLDTQFMQRLRDNFQKCGLNLMFGQDGKLVATPETCADIVRALLDHRLSSIFSEQHYDVPDATAVA
ncbi:DUF4868 domain-containing protein [Mesorhizobium sp. M0189]|uniref:Kiwa anti-phage protein KwaB-like domain-containing protein n=1 Tax=Mesorhizobium sp. M0189 TaxID=2956909 RepID=UPI003337A4F5